MSLKGIFPPMITPFDSNGNVDYGALKDNILKWSKTGLEGFVALGSNSETSYLSETEKLRIIETTVQNADGKTVICGTGLETPKDTIELTNKAASLGADYALILTPSFFSASMNTAELLAFFTEVADASKIPVLIYNVTKFTHVNVSLELIKELSKHPNIAGMKDSNGDIAQLANIIRLTKDEDFKVFVGTASALFPALCVGVDGGILALANCNPDICAEIYSDFINKDYESAREKYLRMMPVNAAVTSKYGVAGLKYACTKQGFLGGFVRKPLLEVKPEDKNNIDLILKEANLI